MSRLLPIFEMGRTFPFFQWTLPLNVVVIGKKQKRLDPLQNHREHGKKMHLSVISRPFWVEVLAKGRERRHLSSGSVVCSFRSDLQRDLIASGTVESLGKR
jgi:hypothetical protein